MIIINEKQKDYELVDSGGGEKLERFGDIVISRPDPEAIWNKTNEYAWDDAHLYYTRRGNSGEWQIGRGKTVPKSWNIEYGDFTFIIKPTSFKHIGIFPEQKAQWEWLDKVLTGRSAKVLNLFAYTGGATLASARAGAEVVHVDASKSAVSWARENAEVSGLTDAPVRWIVDDCIAFLRREIKRGNRYDCIIMDPPAFGHGPKDELWKIEEHFAELIDLCQQVLSDKPIAIILNGYTAGYSAIAYANILKDMMANYGGEIESGELAIAESGSDKLLPCGIFARWETSS
ncbi:MAG: class I SAM-dependent methyltransferase [Candidatus Nomurabacteria bacterium]|nr:class I SAM-dependent methyltransferase [Candidatus Nomurabacteria bacterium]